MRNGGSGGKSEFLEALIKCEGLGWERGGGERGYSRCFTCEEEKEERNKAGEEEEEEEERDVRRWRWRRSSPHPGQ